jgi:hypothetical protein
MLYALAVNSKDRSRGFPEFTEGIIGAAMTESCLLRHSSELKWLLVCPGINKPGVMRLFIFGLLNVFFLRYSGCLAPWSDL